MRPNPRAAASLLVREVRRVRVGGAVDGRATVDLRIRDGVVTQMDHRLVATPGEQVLEGAGRWLLPGLWDQHVHLSQWAQARSRLDVSGTRAPEEVVQRVAEHVAALPSDGRTVSGFGHRTATWHRPPTVAELDAVSGGHPVVLVSGDAHNGWLNSAALAMVGQAPREGALEEGEWFAVLARLDDLTAHDDDREAYAAAVRDAAAHGVVGVVDMEFGAGLRDWPGRVAAGVDQLRVRVASYPDRLDAALATGLRTGDLLPDGGGLLELGPLKVISDGSLNTRTAWCCEPYAGTTGVVNHPLPELTALLRTAHEHGLRAAVHAIGDAAVGAALEAFAASGAHGSVEHAQLVARGDAARMARLGVVASVQPAHLLDDRDVALQVWPDRADRCFPVRSLLDAGVRVVLGSDAPVAALDPWRTMAAAVHRTADEREPWNPDESLTVGQALAASTDGQPTVEVGSRGDVVLLDHDPLGGGATGEQAAAHLRAVRVAATVVGGRVTFQAL